VKGEKRENIPGNPPSTLRSQSTLSCTSISISVSAPDAGADADAETAVILTINVPPVHGTSATSPSAVENVERSSWANFNHINININMNICIV
jgi:hypothetical protein